MIDSMGTTETQTSWTCTRCEVTVRWLPGSEQPDQPDGWGEEDGELHCLGCRRSIAGEVALLEAEGEGSVEARAKLRAAAVIEFEVSRDPTRSDGEIARVVRSSVPAVKRARERLNA
jgi:hypothetical protein